MAPVLGEEPVRLREDDWQVGGLARAWPIGIRGSGENAPLGLTSRNVVVSEFAITPSRDRAPPG